MLLKKTDLYFPLEDLVKGYENVKHLFTDLNQLCVTARKGVVDPLYDGGGRIKDGVAETEYTEIAEPFRGTIFERILGDIPYRTGRVRLFRQPPRHCMSLHADSEKRLHWALVTDPSCFMAFETGDQTGVYHHIPANGFGYLANTTVRHTAVNPSQEFRIHFVLNLLGNK